MSHKTWMPLYVADYLADTGHLTTEEHGAYMLLIMHYWRVGHLPDDDAQLARIVKLSPTKFLRIRNTLAGLFGENWVHHRINTELQDAENKYKKRVEAGRKGNDVRWHSDRIAIPQRSQSQSQSHIKKRKTPVAEPPEFVDFWASKPDREGDNPRFLALKAYLKAIKGGANVFQINAAAKRWAAAEADKKDRQYVKTAVAWLNARMYEDYHQQPERETNLEYDPIAKSWKWKDGCDPERTN